ncbi:MAG: hypothetical protein ABS42_00150 [Bdellovibrio sp. SCN 50-8]|nr:MAG: hypothetical protein ABS42_00150 [Bdellovibrio sp. SCN 50-8]
MEIRQKSDSASTKSSRILTLFGCGGDRDKGKRPLMAAVAAKYSEACFVTSDNPRSEDPDQILNDIWTGFGQDTVHKAKRVLDREDAIRQILQEAKAGDVVLIAGKGHEDYQEIRGERRAFSDFDVATRHLGKEANNEGHYTRSN